MEENIVNFAILFQFIIILFLIFSVYFCISNLAASRIYWRYAKNLAAIFIIIEIIVFLKKGSAAKIVFFFAPYEDFAFVGYG